MESSCIRLISRKAHVTFFSEIAKEMRRPKIDSLYEEGDPTIQLYLFLRTSHARISTYGLAADSALNFASIPRYAYSHWDLKIRAESLAKFEM